MVWDLNLKRKLSEFSWNSPGEIFQINSREIKVNSKTEEKFVIMVSWDAPPLRRADDKGNTFSRNGFQLPVPYWMLEN